MAASGRLDGDLEGRLACIALLLSYKANMELPDKVLLLATTSGAMLASSQHYCADLLKHTYLLRMAVSRRNSSLGLQTSFKEQHRRMLASMSKCMLCMSKRAPSELVNKQPCCMLMQMQDCFTVSPGNV